MSFLSDLFSGNTGNLGNDLAPSNFFSDTISDIGGKNTLEDIGLAVGALGLGAGALGLGGGLAGLGGAATGDSSAALTSGALSPTITADLGAAGSDVLPSAATLTDFTGTTGGYVLPGANAIGSGAQGGLSAASNALDLGGTIGPGIAGTGTPTSLFSTDLGVAATPAATSPTADTGLWSTLTNTLSPISNSIKTVAPILGLGGLGYNLYSGYEQNQALKQLSAAEQQNANTAAATQAAAQSAAAPLISSGETLTTYLSTGTLPPAFQAQVTQAVNAAKAQIIQGYATRGMSTNPNQNSGLAQDLANVDQQALVLQSSLESTLSSAGQQMVQTANSLLSTGLNATQLASEIPIQVAQLNNSLNTNMANAISSFSAALNGSRPGTISLQLPQNIVGSGGGLNLG